MHVLAQHALRQQFVKISEVDNFTCLLGSGSTCIATCVIYTPQPAGTACLLGSGSTCIATCVISPVVSNFSRLQRKFWLNPAPTYPQAKSYPQDADLQAVDKSGMSDIAYSQE